MAIDITVPRLGWDMTEGIFGGWLKQDGDAITSGEPLFSLETDKATQDVEALDPGILRIPADGPMPGDRVPVGKVIGHVVGVGEPARPAAPPTAAPAAGPAARRLARELAVDLHEVAGTGSSGRVTPADVRQHRRDSEAASPERARQRTAISPRAKRLAVQKCVGWQDLRGSGRDGRIRERDVVAALAKPTATAALAASPRAVRLPISATRRTIADRMLRSQQATAPVTITTTVDVTELVRLRQQVKASVANTAEAVPSYTDFLAKLVAIALQQHPLLNARWDGDEIVAEQAVHIGIAVDTPEGLVVPVLRDVRALGLREVAARSRDLIERARQRKLRADEMQGGTFTISNLGSFDVDAFTPIINYPECAVLGVGRIRRQPVVVQDQVVGRDLVTLSLTFDHRIVDGAPAARFLQAVARLVENPAPQLIG